MRVGARVTAAGTASASDGGGITVLAAAIVAAVTSVALAVATAAGVLVERHRLSGAADAAAVAAANAASGAVAGRPCDAAARLAAANRAHVVDCHIRGSSADVEVSSSVGPFVVRAVARAGQPPSGRSLRTGTSKK